MTLDTARTDPDPHRDSHIDHPDGSVQVSRRTALGAACVGCAALLTACGSSDSGSADATTSDAGGGSLLALADLKVGAAKSVTANGKKLVVTRTGEDTAVAFSAICTHQGCTVEPDGSQFACPCHGSVYKNSDGSVVNGPATRALPPVAVTVTGGNVVLA